ncbi:conserved hypothetical protein [uncultured delta proteobacterium]|uniref:Transcriptional regulator, Crp/Fnr family n=1 Tax=uncultured delta proteobacterium TaxID=34034 RepID=A0A212IV37_9DELT|nr:conserved hypothetical protein [uncultured delta proteobacterium]
MESLSYVPIIMTDLNTPWEKVVHLGVPVTFPPKSIISRHDAEKAPGMYLIRRGGVRLSNISLSGADKVLFYLGRGTLFNEVPMLQYAGSGTFTSMEHTEAVFWPRKRINEEFIREYPDLILNLLESISRKMRAFYFQLCSQQQYDGFVNVCRALYSMHLFNRAGEDITPGLTRLELASYLGLHRSSLHKAMARLRDEGIIGEYSKKKLRLLDADRLKEYAETPRRD